MYNRVEQFSKRDKFSYVTGWYCMYICFSTYAIRKLNEEWLRIWHIYSLLFQDGDDCSAQLFRSSRPGPMITDLLERGNYGKSTKISLGPVQWKWAHFLFRECECLLCCVRGEGGGPRITSETAGPGDALHNDLGLAALVGIGQFPKENRSMVWPWWRSPSECSVC